MEYVCDVLGEARLAPWKKYSSEQIRQLKLIRHLYTKHFHVPLEVVPKKKKDKQEIATDVATGAALGAAAGEGAVQVAQLAGGGLIVPQGVGAAGGATAGVLLVQAKQALTASPDHSQGQFAGRATAQQLLIVDTDGVPVINRETAAELLEHMGQVVSSNSLTFNINNITLQVQKYTHHDRRHGFRKFAFQENDPRCLLCMIILDWLHHDLLPCTDFDRSPRVTEIDAWVEFMDEICLNDEAFPVDEARRSKGYTTMKALLLNVSQQFKQMRRCVDAELRERQMAEQLRNASSAGKTTVARLFEFLAYLLCQGTTPPAFFGINGFYQTIKDPQFTEYIQQSPHGALLAEIAHKEEVQEFLDLWCDEYKTDPFCLPFIDENDSTSSKGLTSILHSDHLPTDADVDALLSTQTICPLFSDQRGILLTFLRLHAQLPVVARLLLACREASHLAGALGELIFLRNEYSKKLMQFLVQSSLSVLTEVHRDLEDLWTKVCDLKKRYGVDGDKNTHYKAWCPQWEHAHRTFRGLGTDNTLTYQLERIIAELRGVQEKLDDPDAQLPLIRRRLEAFVTSLNGVCEACPWIPVESELWQHVRDAAGGRVGEQVDALLNPPTPPSPSITTTTTTTGTSVEVPCVDVNLLETPTTDMVVTPRCPEEEGALEVALHDYEKSLTRKYHKHSWHQSISDWKHGCPLPDRTNLPTAISNVVTQLKTTLKEETKKSVELRASLSAMMERHRTETAGWIQRESRYRRMLDAQLRMIQHRQQQQPLSRGSPGVGARRRAMTPQPHRTPLVTPHHAPRITFHPKVSCHKINSDAPSDVRLSRQPRDAVSNISVGHDRATGRGRRSPSAPLLPSPRMTPESSGHVSRMFSVEFEMYGCDAKKANTTLELLCHGRTITFGAREYMRHEGHPLPLEVRERRGNQRVGNAALRLDTPTGRAVVHTTIPEVTLSCRWMLCRPRSKTPDGRHQPVLE